jgi:ATP/maltotriose-dependent transcriptional regulator MalT/DNA-binding SARP family transcriptional activator
MSLAKLSRPRLHDPIPRDRLFRRLDASRSIPLIWLCGPPGSGKTSLISSWLDARSTPFAWYQLDAGDSEPATLFSFLRELHIGQGRGDHALPYFSSDHTGDIDAFSRRFFREFFRDMADHSVLVFDNCHEAEGSPFFSLIEQASSQLPAGMTLVVISRLQPPPQLSRLLANRTLDVIGWEHLRLTQDEAQAILFRSSVVDPAVIEDLYKQADGWAAGLILLAASRTRGTRHAEEHEHSAPEELFAYFAGEIFEHASADMRHLLMRTALLPEVSVQVAIELSNNPQAGVFLEQLFHRQYFVDRRLMPEAIYRYHDLFRQFLLARALLAYPQRDWSAVVLQAAGFLIATSQFESGVELYAKAQAWEQIEHLIVLRAEALMQQGRWQTLLGWIGHLPRSRVQDSPWLLYWRGIVEQVSDVVQGRTTFESAVQLFSARSDRAGQALAISAVVDSYFQEWNTIAALDPWLDALLDIVQDPDANLPRLCMARVQTSLFVGLLNRRPSDASLRDCVQAIKEHSEEEPDPSERLRMMVYLLFYYDLMGQFQIVKGYIARLESMIDAQNIVPRLRLWAVFRFAHHYMFAGDDQRAIEGIERALHMADEEGVEGLRCFLLIGHGMILFSDGQLAAGERAMQKARPLLRSSRHMETVFFHWAELWAEVLRGNLKRAGALWDNFAKMPLVGVHYNLPFNHAAIFLLVRLGETSVARERLTRWGKSLEGMGSSYLNYNLDLMDAFVHLNMGDQSAAVQFLRAAFSAASSGGFYNNACWIPEMMAELCALALQEGIENDYVARLISAKKLKPPPQVQHWVWPVKIFALGRFVVMRENSPIRFSKRPQHRPLELLQAIISAGKSGIHTQQLMTRLWPDSDGDAAHNALSAALHRLRKLLGRETAVLLDDSRVSLNPEVCWVDALVFDRIATEVLSAEDAEDRGMEAIRLYGGHFLGDGLDASWTVAFRDRLRAKLQRLVTVVGKKLEQRHDWSGAINLYRGALEADNLQEEIYRRLIICLREHGEIAEAKTVYRRCKELLSIVLGVSPSTETQAIFETLNQ